jgi:hypothetical protein
MDLDFSLENVEDRVNFVQNYVQQESSLSHSDLELLSNYILWCDKYHDKSQPYLFEKNKFSPWQNSDDKVVSLDALIEKMNELGTPIHTTNVPLKVTQKKVLKKEQIVTYMEKHKDAPATKAFQTLWQSIRELENQIAAYENGQMPQWNENLYNRAKRHLVHLRQSQYQIWDGIKEGNYAPHENLKMWWSVQMRGMVNILPFEDKRLLIGDVNPADHFDNTTFRAFCGEKLREGDAKIKEMENNPKLRYFDFRESSHVRALLEHYEELAMNIGENDVYDAPQVEMLLRYLEYYVKRANLSEIDNTILQMKLRHCSNEDIKVALMKYYNKEHSINYISTIFTKRIINAIIEQVERHYKLIEYIMCGPTVFKQCVKCGKWKPRNGDYYLKRSAASDGFTNYCKECKHGKKS